MFKTLFRYLCLTLLLFPGILKADCDELRKKVIAWEKMQTTSEVRWAEIFKLYEFAKRQDCDSGISWVARRIAVLYKRAGNLDSAIHYHVICASRDEQNGDLIGVASDYNNLGAIYFELKDYPKASEYFAKAVVKFREHGKPEGIADGLLNLAEANLKLNQTQKASAFATEAIQFRRRARDTSGISYDYFVAAECYAAQGSIDSAVKYYHHSMKTVQLDDMNYIPYADACLGLSRVYLNATTYDSALHYANLAYSVSKEKNNISQLSKAIESLVSLYEATGDSALAYKYLKVSKILKDTLLNEAKIRSLIDAERKYDSEYKQREIEHKDAVIQNKNLLIMISVISLIGLIVIAFLIILNTTAKRRLAVTEAMVQKQKVDELLQQQEIDNINSLLTGQNQERKRIAQELHDSLGSMLATVKLHFSTMEEAIASLKERQTRSYNEASSLLDEAVKEVRRISHDLYEGSLEKFGIETALRQLISAIEKNNKVKIDFSVNNVQSMVYKDFERDLYRICQELLGNTLKYANASNISIQFNVHGNLFQFMYEDDGAGFDTSALEAAEGIGYKSIRNRVSAIKGQMHLDSVPGHGMTLIIEVPTETNNFN